MVAPVVEDIDIQIAGDDAFAFIRLSNGAALGIEDEGATTVFQVGVVPATVDPDDKGLVFNGTGAGGFPNGRS